MDAVFIYICCRSKMRLGLRRNVFSVPPDFLILLLDHVLQLRNGVVPIKNLPEQNNVHHPHVFAQNFVPRNTFGNGPGFFSMSPHWRRREEMVLDMFELISSILKIFSAEPYSWKELFWPFDFFFFFVYLAVINFSCTKKPHSYSKSIETLTLVSTAKFDEWK